MIKLFPFQLVLFALIALLAAGCSPEQKRARILKRANAYFDAAQYERAQIEFLNLLQLDPNDDVALTHLGLLWLERGSPTMAAPYLTRVLERSPGNVDIAVKLAKLKFSLGVAGQTKADCVKILNQVPGQPDAVLLLTQLIRTKEDYDNAQKELQRIENRTSVAYQLAFANLAQLRGDGKLAQAALTRAEALDPQSPEPHLAMAQFHLKQNRIQDAESEFEAAAKVAPIRSEARIYLAEFRILRRNPAAAITSLTEITAKAPDYVPAWRGLAAAAIVEKRYDDAIAMLGKVFAVDSSNPQGHILRSQVMLAKGEINAAVELLDRLGKTFPYIAQIKYHSAVARARNRDQAGAITALREAVTLNPEYTDALTLLAELSLQAGDGMTATQAAAQLMIRQPGLVAAQLLLVRGLRSLGKLDEMVGKMREAIDKNPDNASQYFVLGLIQNQQGKTAEARASFEKSLQLAPSQLSIIRQLVDLDIRERRFPEALTRVQQLLKAQPDVGVIHLLEANIYSAQGQWERAEQALLKSIELDPSHAEAYQLLARSFIERRKEPSMMARLQEFLSKRQTDLQAILLGGEVFSQMGEDDKAKVLYEKYLAANPASGMVLNNLAYLYGVKYQQLDQALEKANLAKKLEPGSPEIADTLGWILFLRKDYAAALELFKEASVKLPDNAEVQYHLGVTSKMLGNREEALTALRRAGSSSGSFSDKEKIPSLLAELEQK